MINNNMLYGLGDMTIGNTVTIPSYMALGSSNATLSATDTIIGGEFVRLPLVTKSRTQNLIKLETLFAGGIASSLPINVVGLFNSSGGGNLWANMLMASIMQTTSFDIDVEIWIQFIGV